MLSPSASDDIELFQCFRQGLQSFSIGDLSALFPSEGRGWGEFGELRLISFHDHSCIECTATPHQVGTEGAPRAHSPFPSYSAHGDTTLKVVCGD